MNHPYIFFDAACSRRELADKIGAVLGFEVGHTGTANDGSPFSWLVVPHTDGVISGGAQLYDRDPTREILDDATALADIGFALHVRIRSDDQTAVALRWFEKLKVLGIPMLVMRDGNDTIFGEYNP